MEAIEPAPSSWGRRPNHIAFLLSCLCHPHVIVGAVPLFAAASRGWEKALTFPSQVWDAASHT